MRQLLPVAVMTARKGYLEDFLLLNVGTIIIATNFTPKLSKDQKSEVGCDGGGDPHEMSSKLAPLASLPFAKNWILFNRPFREKFKIR